MFYCSHNKGFTLPELIVSVAVLMVLFAFGSINLIRVITNADLDEVSNTFIADARSQQNSAMLGDSLGQEFFSIKIDTDGYVLFRGLWSDYSESDPGNYKINYPQSVTVTTDFANSVISFSGMNGEINNYDPSHNQVTFTGPDGSSITIKFNKLGNVYYINKV